MLLFLKARMFSQKDLHSVYFWTDTIMDWKYLLKQDKYKQILLDTLLKMTEQKLITVYAFVIMPNHIHLVWRLDKLNGKEKPHASFNKETSHLIVKDLKAYHPSVLRYFEEQTTERKYRIWKRNPMAIHVNSKAKVEQKIDYLHRNPLSDKYDLARRPENYYWSSASHYEIGGRRFSFIKDYREDF